jgi:hypothetical protein
VVIRMNLAELLSWVLSGGGAGVASYFLWNELEGTFPDYMGRWSKKAKRYATLGMASVLAILAYLVVVAMGYEPTPEDVKGWVESVFSVIAVSIGLSQMIHGMRHL